MRYPYAQNGHAWACKMTVNLAGHTLHPAKHSFWRAGRICCAASGADGRTDAREKLENLSLARSGMTDQFL